MWAVLQVAASGMIIRADVVHRLPLELFRGPHVLIMEHRLLNAPVRIAIRTSRCRDTVAPPQLSPTLHRTRLPVCLYRRVVPKPCLARPAIPQAPLEQRASSILPPQIFTL